MIRGSLGALGPPRGQRPVPPQLRAEGRRARDGSATRGATLWGHLDLGGDVAEWALDSNAMFVNPCSDCAHLTATSVRVVKGGSFGIAPYALLPPTRVDASRPSLRDRNNGLRCARAP